MKYSKRLKKLTIETLPFSAFGDKWWIKVLFHSSEWVPSFKELFYILKALAFCENEKYPPADGFDGWRMVAYFAQDSCKPGMTWEAIRDKYKLPDRDPDA